MDMEGALLVGRAVPDDRAHRDERRLVGDLPGIAEGLVHGAQVVAVVHRLDVPAVCGKAGLDVFAERDRGTAREGDAVVVVEDDELAELEVAAREAASACTPSIMSPSPART
jgi:ferredoxin